MVVGLAFNRLLCAPLTILCDTATKQASQLGIICLLFTCFDQQMMFDR